MVDRLDKNMDLLRMETRDLRTETRALRTEMGDLRSEMHAGFAAIEGRMADGFTSLRRDMLYGVIGLSGVVIAALATLLAKAF
jgi:hypothetical protein